MNRSYKYSYIPDLHTYAVTFHLCIVILWMRLALCTKAVILFLNPYPAIRGSFTNYVDKFFFWPSTPFIESFYLIKVVIFLLNTYPPLVNVVSECPLMHIMQFLLLSMKIKLAANSNLKIGWFICIWKSCSNKETVYRLSFLRSIAQFFTQI